MFQSTTSPPTSPLATNSVSEAPEEENLLPWRRDDDHDQSQRSVLNRPESTYQDEGVKSSRF